MTLYVDKRHLFNIKRIEEDGFEMTRAGEIPVSSGDVIITNEYGRVGVVSEEYFNENYIPVEKVNKIIDKDQMALNYSQSWSNFEDNEYINDFQNKVKARNNI